MGAGIVPATITGCDILNTVLGVNEVEKRGAVV
jgi:hypothetical protein